MSSSSLGGARERRRRSARCAASSVRTIGGRAKRNMSAVYCRMSVHWQQRGGRTNVDATCRESMKGKRDNDGRRMAVAVTAAATGGGVHSCRQRGRNGGRRGGRSRMRTCSTQAMVNVDFGPGTVLGFGLIAGGYLLVQARAFKPEVSRDLDIFLSSVVMMSGGILVFQGWRLDPILLFAQGSVVAVALSFALETFKLREIEFREEQERSRSRMAKAKGVGRGASYAAGPGGAFGASARALPDDDDAFEVGPASTWARSRMARGTSGGFGFSAANTETATQWRGRNDEYDDEEEGGAVYTASFQEERGFGDDGEFYDSDEEEDDGIFGGRTEVEDDDEEFWTRAESADDEDDWE